MDNINSIALVQVKQSASNNQDIVLLEGISLEFTRAKSTAIFGPSGSGKTTLLHIISGLIQPASGKAYINNKYPISHYMQKIGIVLQVPHFIAELSALENVLLPALLGNKKDSNVETRAHELLFLLNLEGCASKNPYYLSIGQQQRLAFARALINYPDFLILDEPTSNLDRETANILISTIKEYKKNTDAGIIVSSHDPNLISAMDDHYFLSNGQISKIEKNPNQQIVQTLKELYVS